MRSTGVVGWDAVSWTDCHNFRSSEMSLLPYGDNSQQLQVVLVPTSMVLAHWYTTFVLRSTKPRELPGWSSYKMIFEHRCFLSILYQMCVFCAGISPSQFSKIMNRNDRVACFAVFIGSLGDQARILNCVAKLSVLKQIQNGDDMTSTVRTM